MIEELLIFCARICSGILVRSESDDALRPGVVYYANHTSHLDLIAVLSAFPRRMRRRIRSVAAVDYWGRGWLRPFVSQRILRAILIDRVQPVKVRRSFQEIAAALDRGDSVLIFPEGTRAAAEEGVAAGGGAAMAAPGVFRGGIHLLAETRPDTLFVPVALSGFARTLPKGELLPAPNMGTVTFGRGIRLQPGESRQAFLARARETLMQTGNR